MDSCKLFFRQKMSISSNFHFSSNRPESSKFSTDIQFISLDQEKIIAAHKKCYFKQKNFHWLFFPIQFPDNILIQVQFPDIILIPFFRIFIRAISNSLITIMKFSFKNHSQKYKISGTTFQFSHFSVNSYHISGQFLHIPIDI